jgi:hypothetical protein
MSTVKCAQIKTTAGKTLISSTNVTCGSILQVQQYSYTSVYEDTAQNTEVNLPGVLGDGTASITPTNFYSRILFTAVIQNGQEATWRTNFYRSYYGFSSGGASTQFYGGFGGSASIAATDGGMITNITEFLLPPLYTKNTIYFKLTRTGHAQGGYLHLNQNNTTSSTAANNTIGCSSHIILKEIYAP